MLADLRSFHHGDVRIAYELHGAGTQTIVLIHGLLLDAHVNRDLAHAFVAEGYRVVLVDMPGHGRSDRPLDAAYHRFDRYAEHVLALLDELKLPKAVIGGVSLGANVSLYVAAMAPQRVRALLLEMPVMERATPGAAVLLLPVLLAAHYGRPLVRAWTRLLRRLPRPRSELLTSLMNLQSAAPEEIAAILHGIFVGPVVPPEGVRRAIRMPTLIVGHPGDFLHPLDDAEALSRQIPGSTLLAARSILELRTRPQRLMPQILAFLKQATQASPRATRRRR